MRQWQWLDRYSLFGFGLQACCGLCVSCFVSSVDCLISPPCVLGLLSLSWPQQFPYANTCLTLSRGHILLPEYILMDRSWHIPHKDQAKRGNGSFVLKWNKGSLQMKKRDFRGISPPLELKNFKKIPCFGEGFISCIASVTNASCTSWLDLPQTLTPPPSNFGILVDLPTKGEKMLLATIDNNARRLIYFGVQIHCLRKFWLSRPRWIVGRVQFSWEHFSRLASRLRRSARRPL